MWSSAPWRIASDSLVPGRASRNHPAPAAASLSRNPLRSERHGSVDWPPVQGNGCLAGPHRRACRRLHQRLEPAVPADAAGLERSHAAPPRGASASPCHHAGKRYSAPLARGPSADRRPSKTVAAAGAIVPSARGGCGQVPPDGPAHAARLAFAAGCDETLERRYSAAACSGIQLFFSPRYNAPGLPLTVIRHISRWILSESNHVAA